MVEQRVGSVMVVGEGIAGMQTAVDLAKRFFANAAWWRL
jgi:heterodisulfide reductase subunit A-like polyferredoxin